MKKRFIEEQIIGFLKDADARQRPLPRMIRVDQGPEFTRPSTKYLAHARGVKLAFTQPGKPTRNAYMKALMVNSGMSA